MPDGSPPKSKRGTCVIMAGGVGTRFWPLSRASQPKQFLALSSEKSLLRETFARVAPLVGPERVLVVTAASQAARTAAELPELSAQQIVAEPVGRNTAPCAALGVALAEKLFGPGPVALLPADHWIPDADLFRQQLQAAFEHATTTGSAVTFGIAPDRPETGYGYLETAPVGTQDPAVGPEPVATRLGRRFVEKPDRQTAERYIAGGRHFWNSGIFVWDSRRFDEACAAHLPELHALLRPVLEAETEQRFGEALADAYADCPAISIDYGIMEKLQEFTVFVASFRWSDIGSWDAWGDLAPEIADGNRGRTELFHLDSRRNVVYSPERSVALIGVDDLIVVDTPDALLVCRSEDAQRIRDLTEQLRERGRRDLLS